MLSYPSQQCPAVTTAFSEMRDPVHTIVVPIAPSLVIKTSWGNSPEKKDFFSRANFSIWPWSFIDRWVRLISQCGLVPFSHRMQLSMLARLWRATQYMQWENRNLCCTCITVLPVTTVSRSDNSLLWDEGPGAHQRSIAPTSDQDQVRKFTWKSAAAKILWNYKLWENTLKKLSKIFWEILNQVQHLFPHRFCRLAEKKEDLPQLAQQSQQKWEEDACFRSSWDVSYPL